MTNYEKLKQDLKELALLILTLVVYMPENFKINEEKLTNSLEATVIEMLKEYRGG